MFDDFPELTPEYSCFYEPINKPIPTVEEALKYWTDNFDTQHFMSRRRSAVRGNFGVGRDIKKIGDVSATYSWKKKIDWFNFFQSLQKCINAYFGHIHFYDSKEKDIGFSAGFEIRDLGIPDLGWGTFFGKRFLDRFPKKDLVAKGFTVTPQGDGYVLTLTDDISSLLKDYDAFDQRRTEAKALFPEGVFQKKTNKTGIYV